MLYNIILESQSTDTPNNEIEFANEHITLSDAESVSFEKVHFLKCQLPDSNFQSAEFFDTVFDKSLTLQYCNFAATLWENTSVIDCDLKQSFLSEVCFRKPIFKNVNLTSVDFFKTKLKGIDLSDCNISNIMVSDTFAELAGMKVNIYQAADLARLLNVQIV